MSTLNPILNATNLSIFYGDNEAVRSISLPIYERKITAIIGPSGCGKSTFLRSLNRMNDFIDGVTHKGEILFNEENLYHESVDPVEVRLRIGMVFQKANPCSLDLPIMQQFSTGPDPIVHNELNIYLSINSHEATDHFDHAHTSMTWHGLRDGKEPCSNTRGVAP